MSEPAFSFALSDHPPEDVDPRLTVVDSRGASSSVVPDRHMSEMLFAAYYKPRDPKYWVRWSKGSLDVELNARR